MVVLDQREQEVLGADVGVVEQPRLIDGARDRVAGGSREAVEQRAGRVLVRHRPRADRRLHRSEVDGRAGHHVGRDLEQPEQQILRRDELLAGPLGVPERGLEDGDVATRRTGARSLGTVEQPREPFADDPAVGDADGARGEIGHHEDEREQDVLGLERRVLGMAGRRLEHALRVAD